MRPSSDSLNPSVAVLIAAYKAEETIGRAVRSALAQDAASEVVVVDDASPDDTAKAALAADDGTGRLKVLRQSANQGPAAARNRAIEESSAPYLTVLDSDDFLLPGRLEALLEHAVAAELVGDDLLRTIDAPELPAPAPAWNITTPLPVNLITFVDRNVSRRGAQRAELGFLKPLMSRAFLDAHGLRYRQDMRLGEDFDLYARALALGARMIIAPAAGYVAVTRDGSLSGRHTEYDLVRLRDASALLARVRPMSELEAKVLKRHYDSIDCKIEWLRLIEAVKARSPRLILRPFFKRGPVPGYLMAQLWEQFMQRGFQGKPKP